MIQDVPHRAIRPHGQRLSPLKLLLTDAKDSLPARLPLAKGAPYDTDFRLRSRRPALEDLLLHRLLPDPRFPSRLGGCNVCNRVAWKLRHLRGGLRHGLRESASVVIATTREELAEGPVGGLACEGLDLGTHCGVVATVNANTRNYVDQSTHSVQAFATLLLGRWVNQPHASRFIRTPTKTPFSSAEPQQARPRGRQGSPIRPDTTIATDYIATSLLLPTTLGNTPNGHSNQPRGPTKHRHKLETHTDNVKLATSDVSRYIGRPTSTPSLSAEELQARRRGRQGSPIGPDTNIATDNIHCEFPPPSHHTCHYPIQTRPPTQRADAIAAQALKHPPPT